MYLKNLTKENIKKEVANKPLDTLLEGKDEETHNVWESAVFEYQEFARASLDSFYIYLYYYFDKSILLVPNKTIERSGLQEHEKHVAYLLKKLYNIDELKKEWLESDPALDRTMEKVKELSGC